VAPGEISIDDRSVRTRTTAARRQVILSVAASALFHVGGVWALDLTGVWSPAQYLPIEQGRASAGSIALVASQGVVGPADRHEHDARAAEVLDLEMAERPTEPPLAALPPAVIVASVPSPSRAATWRQLAMQPATTGAAADRPPPLAADEVMAALDVQARAADVPRPAGPQSASPARAHGAARVAADVPQDGEGEVNSLASRRSGGADRDGPPRAAVNPAPVYPPELLAAGVEGRVVLRVRVAASGRAVDVSVHRSSGHEAFDRAALAAVRRWRFNPARRAGIAVETEVAVPVRFVVAEGR
jgi:protein TonB